jgi:hypothetical protein
MIRMLLVFLVTFLIVTFSIQGFRALTGREKWEFTKILAYGIILSMVTVTILIAIVILF